MRAEKSSIECYDTTTVTGTLLCFWRLVIENGVHRMIAPVIYNMIFTLWAWVEVYKMKHNEELINKLFFNSGDKLWDALMNGSAVVATLICTAFFLLALVMLNFKRLIQYWLYIACISILFVVSGGFFHDVMLAHFPDSGDMEYFILAAFTSLFGVVGIAAYFTDILPGFVHQFYVVINCSFVSILYLRILPGYTPWIVLAALVFWDLFAVLTPYGPLRIVQDKASDYGADILRFLMFTSANEGDAGGDDSDGSDDVSDHSSIGEDDDVGVIADVAADVHRESSSAESSGSELEDYSNDSESDCDENETSSSKNMSRKSATAADALNDDSARLGMGDFVFYGVLVGAAASNGSVLATVAAVLGVVLGLMLTFTVPFDTDYTVPAIPISVCLGGVYHFLALYIESAAALYVQ